MFLDDEVVGVAVEFFEGEDGGVAEDDFVDGGGEGVPDCFGVGAGHLCSRSKRLEWIWIVMERNRMLWLEFTTFHRNRSAFCI